MERRARKWVLVATMALVAACGGTAATTTTDPVPTLDTSPATTVPPPTTTTTAPPPGEGGDRCLVGVWAVDNESFFDALIAAEEDLGEEFDFRYVAGDYLISFDADGTMRTVQDEWTFASETLEGTFRLVFNGETTGSWATEGDQLFVTDTRTSLELRAEMEADGETFTIPFPVDDAHEPLEDAGTYRCSGDRLELDFEGFVTSLDRR